MGSRECFVPNCKNNSKNSPTKLFVRIREDLRQKWCRQAKAEYFKVYTQYCCEDHLEPSYWQCILKRYQLLHSDDPKEETLDNEKYFKYLDSWVYLNPEFGTVMLNAKITCRQRYMESFPLHFRLFSGYQGCIRNYINVECPRIVDSDECRELAALYSECKEFYL